MKNYLSIYLAGNIKKGHEKESAIYWTDEDLEFLKKSLSPIHLTFLNPALRTDDLSDQKSVFGRDMTQVFCSDIVFIDARERRGLGVGAEMMWAKMHDLPVLTLSPTESHYRKNQVNLLGVPVNDWTHPFIESLSDHLVSNFEEASVWIKAFASGEITSIKGYSYLKETMQHYMGTQFSQDDPMQKLALSNESFKDRLMSIS